MKVQLRSAKRFAYGVAAVALTGVMTVPYLAHSASAASLQITSRSIQPSSSASGATNVAYKVSFTVPDASTYGGIVVDFCTDSPIPGDTCTAPTGFNVNRSTSAVSAQSGISGFATNTTDTTNNRIIITNGTPQAISSGTAVSFTVGNGTTNGFTNPTPLGTFYARIYTYASAGSSGTAGTALGHNTGTPTGYDDYGGIALSTTNNLTVTAKVQESLVFCVYTGANCAAGGTGVILGDSNGVLASDSSVYTNTAKYDLGTNAQTGAIVRMKGDTLKTAGGTFNITAAGATCTADSTTPSVEQFGMRLSTVGSGQVAQAPYNCAANNHGFDVSTACTSAAEENVTCTYGDRIATTNNLPISSSTSTMEFAAKEATATEAGIYTANLGFIATGTF